MKSWLQDNDIGIYSTHNEGESVITERFIRDLYKDSLSKNVYIDKLADIVTEYKNTYHSMIKLKHVDVKSSTYTDFNVENDNNHHKFNVGDHARVSRLWAPNWSEEEFMIKKVKNIVPRTCY